MCGWIATDAMLIAYLCRLNCVVSLACGQVTPPQALPNTSYCVGYVLSPSANDEGISQ